jgi:hypothetical protein
MEQARTDRAMKRIEDALARIEAAASAPRENTSGGWNLYRKLRNQVGDTLVELDRVIADMER